jgi:hypothetical protein
MTFLQRDLSRTLTSELSLTSRRQPHVANHRFRGSERIDSTREDPPATDHGRCSAPAFHDRATRR